uniref:adenylate cyclase n=1 Tax=Trypanosoma congolense (strain IL3000) TaxID=1068625 RepID=G0V3G0_TRYCI|nr:unnamed protein product [Trypanosoma congolense IL3000]
MPREYVTAISAGFNASMESRNWIAGEKTRVTTLYPEKYETLPDAFIKEQLEKETNPHDIIIVLGPVGDVITYTSLPMLIQHKVVAFSPFTGSSDVRMWIPNLYFLRADPAAETLALIRYALSQLRVIRLGFMYLEGIHYGEKEYALAVGVMSQMGLELQGVFTLSTTFGISAPDDIFNESFEGFAGALPQAVILFGAPEPDTAKFLIMMVADKRTSGAYILCPSSVQVLIAEMWRRALEVSGAEFVPGQLFFTGTNPLAKDDHYTSIQRFQSVMTEYLKSHVDETNITDPTYFLTHDTEGELMVYAWIVGEVMAQALSSTVWLRDRSTFLASLYNQRRYLVNDLVIGDFGGPCEGNAASHGAMCECNQGSKVVFMKKMVSKDNQFETVEGGLTILKSSECYGHSSELLGPLNGIVMAMEDNQLAWNTTLAWYKGALALVGNGELGQTDRFFVRIINTTVSEAAHTLTSEKEERIVTAVFGIVSEDMLDTPNTTFIDPLRLSPRLNKFRRNVIHLSPTLEQQLFVLASHLQSIGSSKALAVICSEESNDIGDAVRRTLAEFDVPLESVRTRMDGEALDGYLPAGGDVFVIGLSVADVEVIAKKLEKHSALRVIVLFSDVALLYDVFSVAFNGTTGAERLVFATNLPHWSDATPSSVTVQRFHTALSDPKMWTPLSLLAFATGRLMQSILPRMEKVGSDTLANFFYADSSVVVDGMRYGVFDDIECKPAGSDLEVCASNYGATQISVWSMSRTFNASIALLAEPMTPSMKFRDPNEGALTRAQLIGVVVGTIFAVLLLLALGIVLCVALRNTRDNDSAPKEFTDPVTLIFTDIESSTALWAAHPGMMADAVATHHRLIRSLIARYGAYEVKTVGDSFMIACRSAFAAVELARDLQLTLVHHDWGTVAIDESYRKFEEERAVEDSDYAPPTARLDSAVYCKLWNGLRVRAGIHTGLCDIRHDEVTKGYDYYGRTPNLAARTESAANGGQVLVTGATYYSLSVAERARLDATPIGPVPLRGVPEPVEMYQLNAVSGRTFAALRLDRKVDLINDESDATDGVYSECGSTHGELSHSAQTIMMVLCALIGTFTAPQREKLLIPFCERWRVSLPRKTGTAWDENYSREVVRCIALKVGHVINFDSSAYDFDDLPVSMRRQSSFIVLSHQLMESIQETTQQGPSGSDEVARTCV